MNVIRCGELYILTRCADYYMNVVISHDFQVVPELIASCSLNSSLLCYDKMRTISTELLQYKIGGLKVLCRKEFDTHLKISYYYIDIERYFDVIE